MRRKLIYFVLVSAFCLTSSVDAANIIWVAGTHDDNGDGAPDDQAWVDLLEAQGHNVDFQRGYWSTLDASKTDVLNAANLIIVSRCSSSGDFDDGGEPSQWNSITTPLILQSVWFVRSGQWFWFNTTDLTGDGGAPTLEVVDLSHPIFDGVTLDVSNQVDILDGTVGPTSFIQATDAGNGTMLSKRADNDWVWIAEWEPGVEFYAGAGQIAGGRRMLFTSGTVENGGVGRGEYNITPEGEKMFLNAVDYMLPKIATNPTPADGGIYVDTWANLSWSPGAYAVSHDVYFGDNFDDVNAGAESVFQCNQAGTFLFVGFPGFPYPDGLAPGTTYYWRIDEVNDTDPNSPWKGDVWSFWIPPKKAYDPNPADGSKFEKLDVELSWTAGFNAKLHTVYFGDNFDDVNSATVGIPSAFNTYNPGTLELEKFYYWRIDEFDGIATHKGDVWSFRTIPIVAITNPNLVGWWKFDEGPGTTAVDWSGHDNHGSLTGTALSWMPDDGMIGGALSFDGTASDTDYVEISTADISLTAGTVAMWAKLRPNPQLPDTRYFFGHTTIPAFSDRIQLYMDNADTILDLGLGDSHAIHTDIMSLTTETWYHVALTWDGGNYVVYVNGEQKANGSYTGLETLNTIADIGNDGNPGDRTEAFNGLLDNVRIYNYALSQAEIPLAMRGDLLLAWGPSPTPGSTMYIRDATPLSWSPGDNASGHDVYFGTDKGAVADADASDTTGIYRGRQGVTIYTPPEVEWGGGPYYWRVDEYNTDATISKGNVWSFTVTDFIGIEDFEDYNDYEPDRIYETWIDGWGTTTNGSTAGYPDPNFDQGEHFVETTIVHGGGQSMPYFYDNNFKYSEATMTLVSARDWTEEGVGVLSLWFYGDASNAAEPMYVALNGSAVVYHDNPDAALIEEWTEWTIDLQEFAAQGVNLTNVNTISIGFGDKNNLQAGGSGLVFFDDIRLYRPAPPEPAPAP